MTEQSPVLQQPWRWIESTAQLQNDYYGGIPTPDDPEAFADYMTWNALAAIKELGEALDEVGWKTWATPRGWVNRDAFIRECVDVNHFVANMLAAVGCTDTEYEVSYRAKQEVNRIRAGSGTYDGRNKCPVCGRALDDPTTRCTLEFHHIDDEPLGYSAGVSELGYDGDG